MMRMDLSVLAEADRRRLGLGKIGQPYRQAARAPGAGRVLEHAGKRSPAVAALIAFVERPIGDGVAAPANQPLAAAGAVGAGASEIVDIADVDVVQTRLTRDRAGADQGRVRRARLVQHL